jgi:hypothetical protein
MSGRRFLSSLLLLASFAATSVTSVAQAPIDVLYAQLNSTILTYTVDPATLQSTAVGQSLNLPGNPGWVRLIPSPNDHFVYVLTGAPFKQGALSVYPTNASGVPREPAIQIFVPPAEAVAQFTIDPSGRFAYLLEYKGHYVFDLRLFTINTATGMLTESPQIQAKFPPNEYCGAGFVGFSPDGSRLRYEWGCAYPGSYPGSLTGTFYYQNIDPQTGQLGPEVEFYRFSDDGINTADEVEFSSRSINNYHYVQGQVSIRIFPFVANPQIPLIDCTSAMLPACGEAGAFLQDPTGQYLVMTLSTGNFEIVKIDLPGKTLVDTGTSFSNLLQPYFSVDGQIMYTVAYQFQGPSTIQINGFNRSTGGLTAGGQVTVPATMWNVFVAQRN